MSHGRPERSASDERLVEQADRRRDARQQVPADAEAVEHLGPVDVGEAAVLDDRPRLVQQGHALLDVAAEREGERLAVQHAHVELERARAHDERQRPLILGDRLVEAVLLGERLGPRQQRLGLRLLVDGDAGGQEARVDAEPAREPLDRLRRRARLAALDLRDVFLREPVAREVGLRQAGGDAKRAEAGLRARRRDRSGKTGCEPALQLAVLPSFRARRHPAHSECPTLHHYRNPPKGTSLKRGTVEPILCEQAMSINHLTELLDRAEKAP